MADNQTEWELADSGTAETEWELADEAPAGPDMSAAIPDLRRDVGIIGTAASRVVTGPGQVMTALGELLGIPGASVEEYTAAVNDLERKIQGGGELNPREKAALNVWQFVTASAVPTGGPAGASGRMFPQIAKVPGAIPGITKTTITDAGALLPGAGAGLAGGAMTFDPSATTPGEALAAPLAGAGLGAGAGLVLGAYPAVKNFAFREFRADPLPQQAGELAQIGRSPITADLPLSNAQRTGRYEAEVQEARVAGSLAKDFYNRQIEELGRRFRSLRQPGLTAGDIGVEARKALSATEARMQSKASQEYNGAIEDAIKMASKDVTNNYGVRVDNITNLVREKGDMVSKLQALLDSGPTKHKAALAEILARVEQQGGTLGMADLIRLHQVGTSLRSPIYKLQKGQNVSAEALDSARLGRELIDAVEQDVSNMSTRMKAVRERAAATGMPVVPGSEADQLLQAGKFNEAAWQKFEDARAGYREFINARDSLEATAFSQQFRSSPRDPEETWREFLQKSPEEQARAANILREHAPGILEELQKWKIRDVSQRMFDMTKEGAASPISVDNFIKELTSGDRVAGEMLWSPQQMRDIRSTVAYLRTIQNKAPVRANPIDPEGTAMALASQSSAFIMRAVYRMIGQGKAEKLFFTPEGIASLRTLATTSDPSKRAYIKALGWLQGQAMTGEPSAETSEEFAVAP